MQKVIVRDEDQNTVDASKVTEDDIIVMRTGGCLYMLMQGVGSSSRWQFKNLANGFSRWTSGDSIMEVLNSCSQFDIYKLKDVNELAKWILDDC